MRITPKMLTFKFSHLATALQWETTPGAVIGYVSLNKTTYGGWSITRTVNRQGDEENIVFYETAREMLAWLDGALYAAKNLA